MRVLTLYFDVFYIDIYQIVLSAYRPLDILYHCAIVCSNYAHVCGIRRYRFFKSNIKKSLARQLLFELCQLKCQHPLSQRFNSVGIEAQSSSCRVIINAAFNNHALSVFGSIGLGAVEARTVELALLIL